MTSAGAAPAPRREAKLSSAQLSSAQPSPAQPCLGAVRWWCCAVLEWAG